MNASIIACSFTISMLAAIFILTRKKKKSISIFCALMINAIILGTAFSILYSDEMKTFGIGDSTIYQLIFAIPLITWANAMVLPFVKAGQPAD